MNIDQFKIWLNNKTKSPLIMGILNVTPDSFSDGGKFVESHIAFDHALKMIDEGANIIDVGGESSRPGALPVDLDEELERVIPVITSIRKRSDILISIDTYKSIVADEAIKAGANIVNDISGLRFDEKMISIVLKHKVPVIVMHLLGNPKNMQSNPIYNDIINELISYFKERIDFLLKNKIKKSNIIIDPGIGFGKTLEHNFIILRKLNDLSVLGCPILVGPSRKSFIGTTLDLPPDQRIEGTAAAVTASIMNGANILRVHDVKEMQRVIKITEKICGIS